MNVRRFLIAMLPFAATARADAQSSPTLAVDLSGSRVAYDGYLPSKAVSLAPTLSKRGRNGYALGSFLLTLFESGSASAVVGAEGARVLVREGRASFDARGSAGMSFYNSIPALDLLGGLRVHGTWPRGGVWGGVEGGLLAGRSSEGLAAKFDLGAWWAGRALLLRAAARPTFLHDAQVTDATADVSILARRLRVSLIGGSRMTTADSLRASFAAIGAHLRLVPGVELTGSWGRALPDLLRRTPGTRYFAAGVRVFSGANAAALIRPPEVRIAVPASQPALVGVLADGDSVVLRLRVEEADSVELSGDFTDWEPRAFTRTTGGEWRAVLRLAPGVYRYNVRVNGKVWIVPAGAGRVADDFGSEVAVLVVRSG